MRLLLTIVALALLVGCAEPGGTTPPSLAIVPPDYYRIRMPAIRAVPRPPPAERAGRAGRVERPRPQRDPASLPADDIRRRLDGIEDEIQYIRERTEEL